MAAADTRVVSAVPGALVVRALSGDVLVSVDAGRRDTIEHLSAAGRFVLASNPRCLTLLDALAGRAEVLGACDQTIAAAPAGDGHWAVLCADGTLARGRFGDPTFDGLAVSGERGEIALFDAARLGRHLWLPRVDGARFSCRRDAPGFVTLGAAATDPVCGGLEPGAGALAALRVYALPDGTGHVHVAPGG